LLLAAAGLVSCRPSEPPPSSPGRLNLVIVLADALRAANLPMYGYPRPTAPFLARLSQQSLVFDNHLANYPGTPISVSQLFTGRLMPPLLMGFGYALAPVRAVDEDLPILPRVLAEHGYRTGLVSAHPWFDRTARVLSYFDEVVVVEPRDEAPYATFADLMPAVSRFLSARAADGSPFFLYLHPMDTHSPHRQHVGLPGFPEVTEDLAVYDSYDEQILYTDGWVGRLVEELKASGLLANTVFVFTADHGEEFNEAGPGWWNRSHGATVRRAELEVPLLVRMPDGRFAGQRFAGLSRHIDVAPTLLGLVAPDLPTRGLRFDGINLAPMLGDGRGASASLSYSWRYWALHRGNLEAIYDQWEDRVTVHRVVRRATNYPESVPEEDSVLLAGLDEELRAAYQLQTRALNDGTTSRELLGRVAIGVPTTVLHDQGPGPTFERRADDDRWFQHVGLALEASPGEAPPPLGLATPWAPGEYRVWVRLHRASLAAGWRNRVEVSLLGESSEPSIVEGSAADEQGRVELGVHRLGRLLAVRFARPEGGVAVVGFELELVDEGAEVVPLDTDLEDRLRALGYVE
jgi:arylsulfatase A-like enzyme